jgi:hypothetical protein
MSQARDRNVCRVCGRKVVIVQNHRLRRGDPEYYTGIGPAQEAVHDGDENGRPVVSINARTMTHLKIRMHERCEAKREREASALL